MNYQEFLYQRLHSDTDDGFDAFYNPGFLFGFQEMLMQWAVKKGRAAIFADCGMGKTPISLVWGQNVVEKTNGAVLLLTPLAVSAQYENEARKFDIPVIRTSGVVEKRGIHITNYEKLQHFSPNDFEGVICDESSILKNYSGVRRGEITRFMRKHRYRLLATATAAPNDYTELGTSSEALGYMGMMDMLNKFFKNNMNNSSMGRYRGEVAKWRLKGHAERAFWRWVCSWARAARKPSDLGFDNDGFELPPLSEQVHVVKVETPAEGMLFDLPAVGLQEQRDERRRSIKERCEKMAELADTGDAVILWCHLNDEGDLLEKIIPGAVQVSGRASDDQKESKLMAFQRKEERVLITKPKIGAWGLNFQHCNHVITFPSHSFEQYYQSVRRCWRFGQVRPVRVDVVTTEGEQDVLKNLQSKQRKSDEMFSNLVDEMNFELNIDHIQKFQTEQETPKWL